MKTQHTPGPWIMHSGMVWKDGPDVYPKGKGLDGIPIARMDRERENGTMPCERDANARLIAAAPELLAACEAIAKLSDGQGYVNMCQVAGQARQAIAKATG